MTRNIIAIDLDSCIGCHSCAVVCKQENNVGLGTFYNKVLTVGPSGTYPDLEMYYLPVACQHCDDPACVAVCPAGATYKDTETGIVLQEADKCIGCGLCLEACPYDVRKLQEGDPVQYADFGFGAAAAPQHVAGTAEKCTFCYHRVKDGDVPFCVEVCPGRARFFGDLDDPNSDVAKLAAQANAEQMLSEAGTGPNVYLLR